MNERDSVIWLHRRLGWGLPSTELEAAVGRGIQAERDRLLAPSPPADLWSDASMPLDPKDKAGRLYAINAWVDGLIGTTTPVLDRIAWMWHGHFVSGLEKVKIGRLMADQIRLFRGMGLGGFAALLRTVTIDPAMMIYLDLRTSTGATPNENYAREVLELFTLGIGNYAEADVQAGAIALTGWQFRRGTVTFQDNRHDDSPQTFLGASGAHDLDSVIAAIVAHPAMPEMIAGVVADELLGSPPPDVVARLATAFVDSHFDVSALVAATVDEGLAGHSAPMLLGPLPWLVQAMRATGATVDVKDRYVGLVTAGQVPMLPPNVAGWPRGAAWLGSASVVARCNLAGAIAKGTPLTSPPLVAAAAGDPVAMASALGIAGDGFSPSTAAALAATTTAQDRLAVALVSPEFSIV